MLEVQMKRQRDTWILGIAGLVLVAGVVAIYLALPALPKTENPRATLLIEVGKILAAGVVVGILGVWAKQVLEGAAERRRQLEAQLTAKRDVFKSLRVATREALSRLRDPTLTYVGFDHLFAVDFRSLLDRWEELEPAAKPGIQGLRSSYEELEAEYNKVGFAEEFRTDAVRALLKWSTQFSLPASS
jgi:hypothetical protein